MNEEDKSNVDESEEDLDSDNEASIGVKNDRKCQKGFKFVETPRLQWLKLKENFLQKFLFEENWGSCGSKQRIIAISALLEYLDNTRRIAFLHPNISNTVLIDTVELLLSKKLPIPPDLIDHYVMCKVASQGKSEQDILLRLEAELVDQRCRAYFEFESAETDRVNFVEDYTRDCPPRARKGWWSWSDEENLTKPRDIIENRVKVKDRKQQRTEMTTCSPGIVYDDKENFSAKLRWLRWKIVNTQLKL